MRSLCAAAWTSWNIAVKVAKPLVLQRLGTARAGCVSTPEAKAREAIDKLLFNYESTSGETLFRDRRDPKPRWRRALRV